MTKISTARPVPRWAALIAHAIPLAVLPSGLWRFAMGLGVPLGFARGSDLADFPHPIGTPYVFALSLLAEAFAFLAVGLVRPWGEVFPRWIPFVGGRNVPTLAAVSAAALGSVAVTMLSFVMTISWRENMGAADSPDGAFEVLMTASYLPMLLWGPLLAIVTVHYYLRRQGHSASARALPAR